MVTPLQGETGDTSDIKITVMQWGTKPTFGILPFIIGTVLTTFIAVLIAAPLGVGCAIFLAEFCPSKIRKILRPLYELLAGIPSVIYGLWGFLTFGPFIGEHVYPFISNTIGRYIGFFSAESTTGRGVLTASIVLSIMILPIIITLSEDAIRTVRRELKEASLALGATRWQTVKKVILPTASSGIISSIILGTGRAIGETMAVLMIMGSTSQIPASIFEPVGTMTSVIAGAFGWSFTSDLTRHALFGIGTILFFMIFTLNIIVFMIQKRTTNGKRKKTGWHFPIQKIKTLCAKKKFTIVDDEEGNESRINEKKFTIVDDVKYSEFTIIENIDDKKEEDLTDIKDNHNNQTYIRHHRISSKKAIRSELLVKIALVIGAIIATSFLFLIIGDVVVKGGLLIKPEFLFVREIMGGLEGGFANAIIGSLFLVALAIGVATPLSLGTAIYVQEYAKANNPLTKIIMFASDTLASTPSIIFGAFGFMFFVLFLEFKFSLIAGGLTLAIMVIPLMLRSSIEAIKSIPHEFREASYAVGATRWQTIQHVVLPPAMPGITSGMIISIGRAIGETAAVMFTAGYTATIVTSIMHPAASMPNLIYNYYELSTKWPIVGAKIYSAALVLIIIVLILNFLAKMMKYRSEKMMRGN
jgi:phosphate transport system permease protein